MALDAGFFIFPDICVRKEGHFRLRYTLFEMCKTEAVTIKSIISDVFKGKSVHTDDHAAKVNRMDTVYSAKGFPGMTESSDITRRLGEQGVKLRTRKEPRKRQQPTNYPVPLDQRSTYVAQSHTGIAFQPQPQPQPNGVSGAQYHRGDEPAYKRQRTSVDFSNRNGDEERYHHGRPHYDPRAALAIYHRDQTANQVNHIYGQAPPDFVSGHQRTNSPHTASPYTSSPQTEESPHSYTTGHPYAQAQQASHAIYHNYAADQYSEMQLSREAQITEMASRYRGQQQAVAGQYTANHNLAFSRPQDLQSSATGTYSSLGRPGISSSSYDGTLRLPSADQLGDMTPSNRQQFPSTAVPNVLPPLESTHSSRAATQHILPSQIMQSIEPHEYHGEYRGEQRTQDYHGEYRGDQ
ncbi:MAG: hypothetical protein Q9221_003409 [Calogaya cf. arnoldii]